MKPILERPHPAGFGGTQKIYRFDNGYGASVVRNPYSYGGNDGLWELAILEFTGPNIDDFHLSYDTPITDDVLGYLSEGEAEEILKKVQALPNLRGADVPQGTD